MASKKKVAPVKTPPVVETLSLPSGVVVFGTMLDTEVSTLQAIALRDRQVIEWADAVYKTLKGSVEKRSDAVATFIGAYAKQERDALPKGTSKARQEAASAILNVVRKIASLYRWTGTLDSGARTKELKHVRSGTVGATSESMARFAARPEAVKRATAAKKAKAKKEKEAVDAIDVASLVTEDNKEAVARAALALMSWEQAGALLASICVEEAIDFDPAWVKIAS